MPLSKIDTVEGLMKTFAMGSMLLICLANPRSLRMGKNSAKLTLNAHCKYHSLLSITIHLLEGRLSLPGGEDYLPGVQQNFKLESCTKGSL